MPHSSYTCSNGKTCVSNLPMVDEISPVTQAVLSEAVPPGGCEMSFMSVVQPGFIVVCNTKYRSVQYAAMTPPSPLRPRLMFASSHA